MKNKCKLLLLSVMLASFSANAEPMTTGNIDNLIVFKPNPDFKNKLWIENVDFGDTANKIQDECGKSSFRNKFSFSNRNACYISVTKFIAANLFDVNNNR